MEACRVAMRVSAHATFLQWSWTVLDHTCGPSNQEAVVTMKPEACGLRALISFWRGARKAAWAEPTAVPTTFLSWDQRDPPHPQEAALQRPPAAQAGPVQELQSPGPLLLQQPLGVRHLLRLKLPVPQALPSPPQAQQALREPQTQPQKAQAALVAQQLSRHQQHLKLVRPLKAIPPAPQPVHP